MTRIAAVIPYPIYPYNSGGQKSHALFYHFFAEQKEIFVVCTNDNQKPADGRYTLVPILGTSRLRYVNILLFFKLKTFIRKNKINVIILEHPYYGWLVYLLKKFTKVKVVAHSHNIEGLRFKTLGKWWWEIIWSYEKWVHRIADYSFFIQKNDMQYAIQNFGIDARKATVITYGITWNTPPLAVEKELAKNKLADLHGLKSGEKIILFNGAFDYKPNRDALYNIVEKINPVLLNSPTFEYQIIVCGRHIPEDLLATAYPHILFLGFVNDIEVYYKGADIFINPVNDGGGIKTKLVEALGFSLTSVSTENGAIGVDEDICNGKLLVTTNNDWTTFANKVVQSSTVTNVIGSEYFNHFYWAKIIEKAITIIEQHA